MYNGGMHRMMCRNLHTWHGPKKREYAELDTCARCGRPATIIVKAVHCGSLDDEIPNELERKAMDAYVRRRNAT